jgi:glycosyltransferase involved in cell wall biosynthesis
MIDLESPLQHFVRNGDPLISAIVPSYNKAHYLEEAVQSILDQNYSSIEILIVNDGSPDHTDEVATTLIGKYPGTVRLINKTNGGISDARNYGIEQARGRLILTLDGDDAIAPGFIENGLRTMRETGVNLVTSNVQIVGKSPGEWTPNPYEQYALRYDNSIPTLVLYDRKFWELTGGYRTAFPFVEDWDFFINCTRFGLVVHRIQEKLFRYRSSDDGLASIFQDCYKFCLSLVMTSNDDLYSIEEVHGAHSILKQMPERWVTRFNQQQKLHPEQWLLYFWTGLAAEGRNDFQEAINDYSVACSLTRFQSWQPLFRLGEILSRTDKRLQAIDLLHRVRILRADNNRLVQQQLNALTQSTTTH